MAEDKTDTKQAGMRRYDMLKQWSGYDLTTFSGRLRHFWEIVSPEKCMNSNSTIKGYQADVERMIKEKADENGMGMMTKEEYEEFRHKRIICASSINPDSKEIIPWPMRTCSVIPSKAPIICGILVSPQIPRNIIFWQWVNQTYNAGLNFGNRNASSKQTSEDIVKAYSAAVSAAIVIALSMRKFADFLLAGRTGFLASLSVNVCNYFAVTAATCTNTAVMRKKEIDTGVLLKDDKTGKEYGMSKVAAFEAISNTLKSRAAFNIPIFFTPLFWNLALKGLNLMPKALTPAGVIAEAGGVALGLYFAMPLNCALYPQNSKIDVERLEPEIRQKAKEDGLTYLSYNKGL